MSSALDLLRPILHRLPPVDHNFLRAHGRGSRADAGRPIGRVSIPRCCQLCVDATPKQAARRHLKKVLKCSNAIFFRIYYVHREQARVLAHHDLSHQVTEPFASIPHERVAIEHEQEERSTRHETFLRREIPR